MRARDRQTPCISRSSTEADKLPSGHLPQISPDPQNHVRRQPVTVRETRGAVVGYYSVGPVGRVGRSPHPRAVPIKTGLTRNLPPKKRRPAVEMKSYRSRQDLEPPTRLTSASEKKRGIQVASSAVAGAYLRCHMQVSHIPPRPEHRPAKAHAAYGPYEDPVRY